MKESEKKILKHFAVKAQRECGLRSRKKHVPMTRMILLECSTSDKIESIDDVKYVMFEDCKDGQQYQCRKKIGHSSLEKNERVTLEQPTDDEIKNLLDINPNKVLEGVEANLLTKDEAENYIK